MCVANFSEAFCNHLLIRVKSLFMEFEEALLLVKQPKWILDGDMNWVNQGVNE